MKRISIAAVLCFLVSACAQTHYGYNHPSASYQQYMQDRYVCLMQASGMTTSQALAIWNESGGSYRSSTAPSCGMWISCLAIKGYVAVVNGGRLKPPPGGGVTCL